MSLLLTEDASFLTTESGNHILVESISASAFPFGFDRTARIIDKGTFWEVDLGLGPVRSKFPGELERMSKKAGAVTVIYE